MTRYVQHKSGVGDKWAVTGSERNDDVGRKNWEAFDGTTYYYLPKSEYIECEPPGKWERVKAEVVGNGQSIRLGPGIYCHVFSGYLWVIDGEAIYLERQVKG